MNYLNFWKMKKSKLIKNSKVQFENIYYLRPENFVYSFLRSKACIDNFKFKNSDQTLDIGCGDGVFSFITYGGTFNKSFDVFYDINNKDIRKLFEFETNDIYGDSSRIIRNKINILNNPEFNLLYATDIMKASIKKAEELKIFKKIILHDSNKPFNLKSDSLDYIYTNSIYYVQDIETHLKELYRMIKPGGVIIAQVKTDKFKDVYPYNKGIFLDWSKKAVKLLDRNIYKSVIQNLKPLNYWHKMIRKYDFKIINTQNVCTKNQAQFWLYGMRYVSPFLIYLFNELDDEKRCSLKKDFINYTKPITSEILKDKIQADDTYEVTFCLTK
jgi:SAM-dependent methyltransferase